MGLKEWNDLDRRRVGRDMLHTLVKGGEDRAMSDRDVKQESIRDLPVSLAATHDFLKQAGFARLETEEAMIGRAGIRFQELEGL